MIGRHFAVVAVAFAFGFAGCKKLPNPLAKADKGSPSPAPAQAATATPVPTPAKPTVDQSAQVVVYGYHRFVDKVRRPDTEITPQMFEEQMKELKDKNIPVIGMQDFLAWKRGEKSIPPKSAVITLDDGWITQYTVAWPILKKYEFPFTMFVYTEGLRPGGHFAGGGMMTWDQLAEMRDAGVDIQAHSVTHQDLRKPYDAIAKKKLSPEEYTEWLRNETAGVKKTLEEKLGIRVNAYAVPYGKHDENVRKAVMDAGYEGMFTVYGQPLTFGSAMDSLGRYLMEANKPKVFTDALAFGGASAGAGPAVAQVTTATLSPQPAEGETVKTATPLIKANLATFGEFEPDSLQMRISGLGLVQHQYDPATKTISYQLTQKLRDKSATVIIEARAGARKQQGSWSFNIDEAAGGAAAPAAGASPSPAKR
ncbi:MAG: polysaccharide deacetylase family protein [Chthoniobacterales bacterium]|nr:polysaccharide deacetylase family protein [Chthoniobacterales bacterium]